MLNFLIIRCKLFFAFLFFSSTCLYAQLDNHLLEERFDTESTEAGSVWLKLQSYNFLRNNEYFNPIISGETLLGTQLGSTVLYKPLPQLSIEGGVFFAQDFGRDNLRAFSPIFRISYQQDSTKIIFGNLHANYAHRLIEPLYGFEQAINRRLEHGLQLIRHRPRLYSELWIDWQQIVPENKDKPEIFWVGFTSEWRFLSSKNFHLSLPLQITLRHTGGQDLSVPVLLGNELNAAVGLKAQQDFSEGLFVKKIYAEFYGLHSSEQYGGPNEIDRNGNGLYYNLGIDTKPVHLLFSLWQGDGFNATQGGDLYKSFSQRGDAFSQAERALLFVRLFRDWIIQEDLSLSLRAEPYYDFQNELLEFSFGFYITYRPLFRIGQVIQKK